MLCRCWRQMRPRREAAASAIGGSIHAIIEQPINTPIEASITQTQVNGMLGCILKQPWGSESATHGGCHGVIQHWIYWVGFTLFHCLYWPCTYWSLCSKFKEKLCVELQRTFSSRCFVSCSANSTCGSCTKGRDSLLHSEFLYQLLCPRGWHEKGRWSNCHHDWFLGWVSHVVFTLCPTLPHCVYENLLTIWNAPVALISLITKVYKCHHHSSPQSQYL